MKNKVLVITFIIMLIITGNLNLKGESLFEYVKSEKFKLDNTPILHFSLSGEYDYKGKFGNTLKYDGAVAIMFSKTELLDISISGGLLFGEEKNDIEKTKKLGGYLIFNSGLLKIETKNSIYIKILALDYNYENSETNEAKNKWVFGYTIGSRFSVERFSNKISFFLEHENLFSDEEIFPDKDKFIKKNSKIKFGIEVYFSSLFIKK